MKAHFCSEVIFRRLRVNSTVVAQQQMMKDKRFDRSFIHVLENWLSCIFIGYKLRPPLSYFKSDFSINKEVLCVAHIWPDKSAKRNEKHGLHPEKTQAFFSYLSKLSLIY